MYIMMEFCQGTSRPIKRACLLASYRCSTIGSNRLMLIEFDRPQFVQYFG